jgi:hypothetical protein
VEKYLLKTPGAGFLTNENVPIKSLPYVQNCLKRNSKPQFVLLERNSAETKKVKSFLSFYLSFSLSLSLSLSLSFSLSLSLSLFIHLLITFETD